MVEAATATIKAHGLVGSNLLSRDGCYILKTHEVTPRKKKGQTIAENATAASSLKLLSDGVSQ